jgi:hypothetical protein
MSPTSRTLRPLLLIVCIAVYLAGMGVVIGVARGSPLRAITDVRFALCAYCGIVATCLIAMIVFLNRVAAADAERR